MFKALKMQSRIPSTLAAIAAMILVVNVIAWVVYFAVIRGTELSDDDVLSPPPPSFSVMGVYNEAAIVTTGAPCAAIGRKMLTAGGSAVDAAIATLLCDGVMVMQSLGVGGGCLMTIYNKTERKAYSLVARETAPAAATKDMYVDGTLSSTKGPIAAGVPGELKGYQEAHRRFGKLPWRDLFQPTIKLCEEGFVVSDRLAEEFAKFHENIVNSQSFV